jgi:hypothetical protein
LKSLQKAVKTKFKTKVCFLYASIIICQCGTTAICRPLIRRPLFRRPLFRRPLFRRPLFRRPLFRCPLILCL